MSLSDLAAAAFRLRKQRDEARSALARFKEESQAEIDRLVARLEAAEEINASQRDNYSRLEAALDAERQRTERLAKALQALYDEAASSWDDDDIDGDSSYAQHGGVLRARTLHASRAALADFPADDIGPLAEEEGA